MAGTVCPAQWDRQVLPGPGGIGLETWRHPMVRRLAHGLLVARHDTCRGHPDPAAPRPGPPHSNRRISGGWRVWLRRCGRCCGWSRGGQPGCGERAAAARAGRLGAACVCSGTGLRDFAGCRRAADACPVRSNPPRSCRRRVRAERTASGAGHHGDAHRQAGQPGCGKHAAAARAGRLGPGGVCVGSRGRDLAGCRRAADACPARSNPPRSQGRRVRAERTASGSGHRREACGQAGQPGTQGQHKG